MAFLWVWIQITKKDKNAQKTSLSSSTHTGAEELKRKHKKSTTTASPWIEFLLIFSSFFLFIVDAELSLSSFSSSPVGAPIGNEDYMRMKRDGIRWGFWFLVEHISSLFVSMFIFDRPDDIRVRRDLVTQ